MIRILKIMLLLSPICFHSCAQKTIGEITGIYINQNYDYEPFIAEIPYENDTLILEKDLSFISGYFGEGKYELKGQYIVLHYTYEMGKGSFKAPIEKDQDGRLKIILFRDKNHHYKKID